MDVNNEESEHPAAGLESAADFARAWAATIQTCRGLLTQQMADSPDMSDQTRAEMNELLSSIEQAHADSLVYASSMTVLSARFARYVDSLPQ